MQHGLYGVMNRSLRNLRGRKGQRGFTLIELLVVVTILGILAAIVTLSLVGLTTNASVQSCKSEYKTVQAALDAFMAAYNVDTVNPYTNTNDMQGSYLLPLLPSNTPPLLALYNPNPAVGSPNFTRNGTTSYHYDWDPHGKITKIYNAPAGCAVT